MIHSPLIGRALGRLLLAAGILSLSACGGSGGSTNPAPASSSVSSVSSSSSSASSAPANAMIHAKGTQWVDANDTPMTLKGTNLGNWLVQEFWMMGQGGKGVIDQCTLENTLTQRFGYSEKERLIKLFRDSWITERDWDQMKAFGFNLVRIPILWSVIEDENNPKTLRADAWQYLDWAIAQAKARQMYVILDLHGVQGGQTVNDHTGCSGQNKFWTTPADQDRAQWLWEQIAARYKDETTVAAYDPLNEPWGSTSQDMATQVTALYQHIRTQDTNHLVLLPSYFGDITPYGNPADKGMTNVAFEIHPYPGLFGDRPGDSAYNIHRDWLRCGVNGTGGVCDWNKQITALNTPLLVGEFQPWQSAGLDLGGQIARATYDTYNGYGWAATSWAYKLVSNAGGQGKGTWGMVTNAINPNSDTGVGLVAKASTWDCAGWDSSFSNACAVKSGHIKVGGTGSKTYYLLIKVGANDGSNPDVSLDNISISNDTTSEELIINGGFGSNTGWTELKISGSETLDYNFSDSGKTPTGSTGASLHITRPQGVTGEINGGIYQAISLEGGQSYSLNGLFKDNGSSNTWAEIYLVDQLPVDGVDVVDMTGKVDFTTAPETDIENLFKGFATQAYDVHSGLLKYLTDTPTKIFTLPARPTGLKAVQGIGQVTLDWTANTEADLKGYRVYRSTQASSTGSLIADNLTQAHYVDTTAVDGTTYYYTVTAFDNEDESYASEAVANQTNFTPVPAKIEAEAFTAMSGIQLESCSDTGGGQDVGHFDPDDYIEFNIHVATAGNFAIDYRLATANGSTGFEVLVDGVKVDAEAVANTGGWQSWVSVTSPSFAMAAGNHTLRFHSIGKEWNINWFQIKTL